MEARQAVDGLCLLLVGTLQGWHPHNQLVEPRQGSQSSFAPAGDFPTPVAASHPQISLIDTQ